MNVSLLRDNKLLHGGERRGSRMSVRVPSRQPSMTSLRPHSPNASIGKQGTKKVTCTFICTRLFSLKKWFEINVKNFIFRIEIFPNF